jgi:hypothetical protein
LQADGAQPGQHGGVGHGFFKVVHVHERGRTGADHLGGGNCVPSQQKLGLTNCASTGIM